MLKRSINFNNVEKVSCLLLLLLTFLTINPISSSSAFAEENGEEVGFGNTPADEDTDDEVMKLAVTSTASTMNISFSPTAGTATAPIGTPTKFQVTATVNVQNSGGYTIYFGSNNQNLTRSGGTETIAPISGNVEFNSLENNTWGYAVQEGNTVADNATYAAVPGSIRGRTIYTNNSTNIPNDSKTYTLSFAARIGTDKPAGTYSNSVTMSVVSSPLIVSDFSGITDMQAMTSAICSAAAVGDEAQLKDTRDGKYYWVAKLADDHCWMTQNLDLDLATSSSASTAKTFTDANTDLQTKTSWTPTSGAYTTVTKSTILANDTGQRSWNLGDYRIASPATPSNCGLGKNSLADCASQFITYTTPTTANNDTNAHYIVGNYYQWCAATAGCSNGSQSGSSLSSGEASDSICPRGWRLPTNGDSTIGSFSNLITVGDIGSDVSKLTGSPYYFVAGGDIHQETDYLLYYAGYDGYYWSSTSYPNDSQHANDFRFRGSSEITPSGGGRRYLAKTVRCVAR